MIEYERKHVHEGGSIIGVVIEDEDTGLFRSYIRCLAPDGR